jgi:hypothetical protein
MNNSRSLHSLVFSLIAAVPVMLLAVLIQMVSDNPQSAWNYLSYLFLLGALMLGQLSWRKNALGGYMTFGQAFRYSMLFLMWYSIIMAIWTVLFTTVIAPDMVDRILEQSRQQLESKGISEDQIEIGLEMTRKIMNPAMMAVFALFGNFIFGLLFGLLASAFTKKDKPFQPFQPQQ